MVMLGDESWVVSKNLSGDDDDDEDSDSDRELFTLPKRFKLTLLVLTRDSTFRSETLDVLGDDSWVFSTNLSGEGRESSGWE